MYRKNYWVYLLFVLGCGNAVLAAEAPEETKDEEVHVNDEPKHYFFLIHKTKEKDQFKGQIYLPDFLEREVAHAVSSLESLSAEEQASEVKEIVDVFMTLYVRKSPSESGKDSFRFSFKKNKNKGLESLLLTLFGEAYHTFCPNKRIIKGSRAALEKHIINNQGIINTLDIDSLLPIHYQFFGHFNIHCKYYKDLVLNTLINDVNSVERSKIDIFIFGDTGDHKEGYTLDFFTYRYDNSTTFKDIYDYCTDTSDSIQIDEVGYFFDKEKNIRNGRREITDVFFEYSEDAVERAKSLTMCASCWVSFGEVAKTEERSIARFKNFGLATSGFLFFLFGRFIEQAQVFSNKIG